MKTKILKFATVFILVILSSPLCFAKYVVRIKTKKDHIGNRTPNISHAMLKVKLYGQSGSSTHILYPGAPPSGDIYWSAGAYAKSDKAYLIKGHGKAKSKDPGSIWADRVAWWENSTYYFNVPSKDLGHIYKVHIWLKTTHNDNTQLLGVSSVAVFKGNRVGTAKYAYYFPGSSKAISGRSFKSGKSVFVEDYKKYEPVYTPSTGSHAEAVAHDNVQGKGKAQISISVESNTASEESSDATVNDKFDIEATVSGTNGPLAAEIKSAYGHEVTRSYREKLSHENNQTSSFNREVEPGEYFIMYIGYNSKKVKCTSDIEFYIRKKKDGHFDTKKKIVTKIIWHGHNDLHSTFAAPLNTKSFQHTPSRQDLLDLFKAFDNKQALANSLPTSD